MGFEPAVIRLSFSIPTKSKNRCHNQKKACIPLMGLEPTIFELEVQRLIH